MTHSKDHHRINICFDTDPENIVHTIDVFGHRITPHQGYSLEDIMMYIVIMSLGYSYRNNFVSVHTLNEISAQGLRAPFGDIREGAIVCSKDTEITGSMLVTCDGNDIRFGDGTQVSIDQYNKNEFFDVRIQNQRLSRLEHMTSWINEKAPRVQMMMALVAEAMPAPFQGDTVNQLGAIYARIVRLMDFSYASGAAGSKSAREDMKKFWSDLARYWLLEPDHIHRPVNYRPSPQLAEAFKNNTPEHFRALARDVIATTRGVSAEDLNDASIAKRGQAMGESSHQSLQLFSAIKKLDDVIEQSAPIDMLKPGAQKRQQKLRKI